LLSITNMGFKRASQPQVLILMSKKLKNEFVFFRLTLVFVSFTLSNYM